MISLTLQGEEKLCLQGDVLILRQTWLGWAGLDWRYKLDVPGRHPGRLVSDGVVQLVHLGAMKVEG